MFKRKDLKANARKNLNGHYAIFMVACLFAAFLGVAYTGSLSAIHSFSSTSVDIPEYEGIRTIIGPDFGAVLNSLLTQDINNAENISSNSISNKQDTNFHGLELGHSRGVLASIVNSVSSGSILVTIFSGIQKIVGSQNITYIIFILLTLAMIFLFWMFFINTYKVTFKRLFLEGRLYEKVPMQRFLYLFRVKRLNKSAVTILLQSVFQLLWDLTIIGGVIKRYSYFPVPYIVAENPDIAPLDAINLSRKLMKGHKWECFVLDLSFLGWDILGFLTFGLLSIFYVNPYKESAYCEYYAYIRKLGIKAKAENIDKLNDVYLYKRASDKKIKTAYSDILELMEKPMPTFKERRGFWKFMADFFGVIPSYDKSEQDYIEYKERLLKIKSYKMFVEGKTYPARLYPIAEKEKDKKLEFLHYIRHYSICSIILIFFTICLLGFIWEVSLNLIIEGSFAKKGMLHGPWLPIYGSGSIMILTVLNKLRSKPVLEFSAAIVLCGVVEYFTSLILELAHDGQMWWDYSGYFLNLQGRICAEGLLVFGVGGIAIVYLAAPLLDNLIRKIPLKVAVPVCIALSMLFLADVGYSSVHPNTGKGITDYDSSDEEELNTVPTDTKTSHNDDLSLSVESGIFIAEEQDLVLSQTKYSL